MLHFSELTFISPLLFPFLFPLSTHTSLCFEVSFHFKSIMNQHDDGAKADPTGSGKAEKFIHTKEAYPEQESRKSRCDAVSSISHPYTGLGGSNSLRVYAISKPG